MAKKQSETKDHSKPSAKSSSKVKKPSKSSASKPKTKSSSDKPEPSKVTKDVTSKTVSSSTSTKGKPGASLKGKNGAAFKVVKPAKPAKTTKGSVKVKGKDSTKAKTKAVKTKPQGKVVKAPEFEDLNETALADSKKKKSEPNSKYVDSSKISKALSELKKFIEKSEPKDKDGKSQLFEDDLINNIQIILSKKELFTSKKSFKPRLIRLEDLDAEKLPKRSVALFVRDDLITKEELEKIEESELHEVIGEIIPGSELKTTYKQFEKRRELFSQYDIFLSDDALITSLPKLLGKTFYDSRKVPIPVKIQDKISIPSLLNQIQKKVLKSIVYQTPRSNSLIINLGSIDSLSESAISTIINHFRDEKELTAIYLKSNQSPSLPLYECKKVYSDEDVKANKEVKAKKTHDDVELSIFEKGLVELADPDSEIQNLLKTKKNRIYKTLI